MKSRILILTIVLFFIGSNLIFCSDEYKSYIFMNITSCKTCNIELINDYVKYFNVAKIPINIVITNVSTKNIKSAKKVVDELFNNQTIIYDTSSSLIKKFKVNDNNSFVLLKNNEIAIKFENLKFESFDQKYFSKFFQNDFQNITKLNFQDNYPLDIDDVCFNSNTNNLSIFDGTQNYLYYFDKDGEIVKLLNLTDALMLINEKNKSDSIIQIMKIYNKRSRVISFLKGSENKLLIFKFDSLRVNSNIISPIFNYKIYDFLNKIELNSIDVPRYVFHTINSLLINNKVIGGVFDKNYDFKIHDSLLKVTSIIGYYNDNGYNSLMSLEEAQDQTKSLYSFNFLPTLSYIDTNKFVAFNQLNSLFTLIDINRDPKIVKYDVVGKLKAVFDLNKTIDKLGLFKGYDIDIPKIDSFYINGIVSNFEFTFVAIVNKNLDGKKIGLTLQKYSNRTGKFVEEKDIDFNYRINDNWKSLFLISADNNIIKFIIDWEKEGYEVIDVKI